MQRVLFKKYRPRSGSWRAKSRNLSNTMAFWKGLLAVKWAFWSEVAFKGGKGNRISFWKDHRLTSSLRTLFPKLFNLKFDKEGILGNYREGKEWKIRLRRCTSLEERKQLTDLNSLIITAPILDTQEDIPVWRWDLKGEFIVRLTNKHLIDGGLQSAIAVHIWKAKCPLKVKAFLWLIEKNVILTLHRRGVGWDRAYAYCVMLWMRLWNTLY